LDVDSLACPFKILSTLCQILPTFDASRCDSEGALLVTGVLAARVVPRWRRWLTLTLVAATVENLATIVPTTLKPKPPLEVVPTYL